MKRDFFARGTVASGTLVRLAEKVSVGRAGLPSNVPSSVFLLADFCFGGRVTNADILANSGLGSRFVSSSGFFSNVFIVIFFIGAVSGVGGLGDAVPNFNVIFGTASKFLSSFSFSFRLSFFSLFSLILSIFSRLYFFYLNKNLKKDILTPF